MIASADGCYLVLYGSLNKSKILLANIYAPNKDTSPFFQTVFKDIDRFSPDYKIIAGDLNLAMDPTIDRWGSTTNHDQSAQWLKKYCENSKIVDAWRTLKADSPGFTYRKVHPQCMFSRLDYFLVSEPFMQFIDKIELSPAFKTDHSIVMLTVEFDPHVRGPGYWKLNTQFWKKLTIQTVLTS